MKKHLTPTKLQIAERKRKLSSDLSPARIRYLSAVKHRETSRKIADETLSNSEITFV